MPLEVIVIPADPREPIRLEKAPSDTEPVGFANWARELLGGYLELHKPRSFPRSGILFWIDEDAKSKKLSPNLRATRIALLEPFDFIAGDAVVTGSKGPETASCPLDLDAFTAMANGMMMKRPGADQL